jgi:hypothetical protein
VAAAVAFLSIVAAACTSPPPPRPHALPTTTTTTTVPLPVVTTTTLPAGNLPWGVVSTDAEGIAAQEATVTVPSGRQVVLVRFRSGAVRFHLHIGSTDPPADLAALPPDRGPAIASDEAAALLGAFNGGFKMNAHVGGVEEQGQIVSPLSNGFASLVIDTDGTAHVGVWGSQLPVFGEQVASVRQNQQPLITNGVANSTVAAPGAWGATVNGSMLVARSAVGEDAQGNLIFAGGTALWPKDLSDALLSAAAVNAMQLDINPAWVQIDAAATPGRPLAALLPGQSRPADQYLVGWTRDFIAVLTPSFEDFSNFRP